MIKGNLIYRLGRKAVFPLSRPGRNGMSQFSVQKRPKFLQPLYVPYIHQPIPIGRKVQVQTTVGSHRIQIYLKQPFQAVRFLFFMPEPPGTDRHVDLCRCKCQPFGIQNIVQSSQVLAGIVQEGKVSFLCHRPGACLLFAVMTQFRRNDRPFRMPRGSGLISTPPDIRAEIVEDHGIRLIFSDQLKICRKIIFLFLSIRPFSAGVIKTKKKNISVFRQKLFQLSAEIFIVCFCPIQFAVAVPWRQVKPEFNPSPAAGLRRFLYHISPTG